MNDKFNLHMKVFIYLLMLNIHFKCLIVLCYIEGLYILCKTQSARGTIGICHFFLYVKIYLNQSLKYQVILQ